MSVRVARPGEVKPRVHKGTAFLWPWIADVPFIPRGGPHPDLVLVNRSIHRTWESALHAALTLYREYRP